jgi:hypothetical protein
MSTALMSMRVPMRMRVRLLMQQPVQAPAA